MQPSLDKDRKYVLNTLLLVLGYGLFLYGIQFFLFKINMVTHVPGAKTLLRWDAGEYEYISKTGYSLPGSEVNNNGFYILFPFLWRLLHVGVCGISIFNFLCFATGFTIVASIYRIGTLEKILWLSTPSLYFMYVPYTESLFCLFAALTFYGIRTKINWLVWVSLFLVSLTRATAVFLIPSLLIMELLTNERKNILHVLLNYLLRYASPVLAGLFVFVMIQYYQTGIWFAYFKQQIYHAGHEFLIPTLPFSNFYGEQRVTWLSALAMFVCLVSLISLCIKGFRWLFKKQVSSDKVLVLALTYLPAILFIMVFCNPIWGSNTTNLFGLHRYTLCTPFIFVFLHHFCHNSAYRLKYFIAVFVLCNITWMSMGAYLHIRFVLFYSFNTLLVFSYMLHANKKIEWATMVLVALNVFIQINLFQQYLGGLFTD